MQLSKNKIAVITCEESGDLHAAAFIKKLKQTHPSLYFMVLVVIT